MHAGTRKKGFCFSLLIKQVDARHAWSSHWPNDRIIWQTSWKPFQGRRLWSQMTFRDGGMTLMEMDCHHLPDLMPSFLPQHLSTRTYESSPLVSIKLTTLNKEIVQLCCCPDDTSSLSQIMLHGSPKKPHCITSSPKEHSIWIQNWTTRNWKHLLGCLAVHLGMEQVDELKWDRRSCQQETNQVMPIFLPIPLIDHEVWYQSMRWNHGINVQVISIETASSNCR